MIAVFGGTPLNVAPQAHASLTSPSTRPWEVHDELSAHSSVSPSLSPACCLLYGWNFMNHTKNRIDSGMKYWYENRIDSEIREGRKHSSLGPCSQFAARSFKERWL